MNRHYFIVTIFTVTFNITWNQRISAFLKSNIHGYFIFDRWKISIKLRQYFSRFLFYNGDKSALIKIQSILFFFICYAIKFNLLDEKNVFIFISFIFKILVLAISFRYFRSDHSLLTSLSVVVKSHIIPI